MTTRTLVAAAGVLLRLRDDDETSASVVLEMVRPNKRARPWRAVPRAQVRRHAREWAEARGISLEGTP